MNRGVFFGYLGAWATAQVLTKLLRKTGFYDEVYSKLGQQIAAKLLH